jgi:ABC-type multidrug transport system fused ATPase/permease subunit
LLDEALHPRWIRTRGAAGRRLLIKDRTTLIVAHRLATLKG